jgi:hypothetical protein
MRLVNFRKGYCIVLELIWNTVWKLIFINILSCRITGQFIALKLVYKNVLPFLLIHVFLFKILSVTNSEGKCIKISIVEDIFTLNFELYRLHTLSLDRYSACEVWNWFLGRETDEENLILFMYKMYAYIYYINRYIFHMWY